MDPDDPDLETTVGPHTTTERSYENTTPNTKIDKSQNGRGTSSCSEETKTLTVVVALLAVLLIISLACNTALLFFWMRSRKQKDTATTNEPRRVSAAEASLAAHATLKKYERAQEHGLEDHRYSSLSLRSEDKYEYIDSDVKNNPKYDSLGYLVPDDNHNSPVPPARRNKLTPPLARRQCVEE